MHIPVLCDDLLHNCRVLIGNLGSHDAHIRGRACPDSLVGEYLSGRHRAVGFALFGCVYDQVKPGVQLPHAAVVIVCVWVRDLNTTCTCTLKECQFHHFRGSLNSVQQLSQTRLISWEHVRRNASVGIVARVHHTLAMCRPLYTRPQIKSSNLQFSLDLRSLHLKNQSFSSQ